MRSATFHTTFSENSAFNTVFNESNSDIGVTWEPRQGGSSQSQILSNTTDGWNRQTSLIAQSNFIYVYTDYLTEEREEETVFIPGIKIGDGTSYLIDIPFVEDPMVRHMNNSSVHVTQAEKDFWNNKVRAIADDENITLTIY